MPLRIGHRGAAGHERENTSRSFLRALDIGVDLIETDLRETADHAIVLVHDAWIDIAGVHHQVCTSTLADLRAAVRESISRRVASPRDRRGEGGPERSDDRVRGCATGDAVPLRPGAATHVAVGDEIATLDDLLAIAKGRCGLMLEAKVTGLAERTVAAVAAAGFTDPLIYASFHHDELLAIRRLQPDARTLALIHGAPVDKTQFAIDAQATHAGINIEFATAELVSALHDSGLHVFIYTVNEPADIAAMKALHVDGIVSDYPDRL